jgi:putative AlgH/UPF0301 family transcriptional regulator
MPPLVGALLVLVLLVFLYVLLPHSTDLRRETTPIEDKEEEELSEAQLARLDAGLMQAIETSQIAPVYKIGSHAAELRPGALIRSTNDGSVFRNALVLMVSLGSEFYVGYVVNKPLSAQEAATAMRKMRVANNNNNNLNSMRLRTMPPQAGIWLGVGGPVTSSDSAWTLIHWHPDIEDCDLVNSDAGWAVGGNAEQLLARESDAQFAKGFMALYGKAVWLPGQLEREIDEGMWEVVETTISSPPAWWPLVTMSAAVNVIVK